MNKFLYIFLILIIGISLFSSSAISAADLCDPCDCAVGGGCCGLLSDGTALECRGDSSPGDGIEEGRCYRQCLTGAICIYNPITSCTFEELVKNIINFIFMLALAIAPIMFIIAGFAFITAAGDPAKIQKAKDIVLWTAIGLMVVLLAKGIITVIQEIFGG